MKGRHGGSGRADHIRVRSIATRIAGRALALAVLVPAALAAQATSEQRTTPARRAPTAFNVGGGIACEVRGVWCDANYVARRDRATGIETDQRLTLIVMIRADEPLSGPRTAALRPMRDQPIDPDAARRLMEDLMRQQRDSMRAREDRGRRANGTWDEAGRFIGYEVSMYGDTIFVDDRAFLPPRGGDSALVVLVDRRTAATEAVRAFMIPSAPPEGTFTTRWTRGDTTFIVSPRDARPRFEAFLRAVPAIDRFLADLAR